MADDPQQTTSENKQELSRRASPPHDFPVVGLGASAGGLKALIKFFELMPASSGMAFVVILHLSPNHESHSAELLQNVTRMPVTQVNEAVRVEPNHVYVIPPTQHLQMVDGLITLKDLPPGRTQHVAIDLFFRTLADAHKDRAVCIVLSGTGSDGAVGLTRIKEEGGVAMAQSPDDAEYDSMPRNAIGTGVVDFVLPVAEMPEKLIQLWQNASVIKLPPAEEQIRQIDPTQAAEEALRNILIMLRSRTGHDFMHYKRATVLRRIERRMQVNQLPNLPAYLNYLRDHQEETPALLRDLLISVTNFFRDREAFEALEREVIPRLFVGKSAADQVRVWVAGCATGEEAYSIAMLLLEHAAGMASPPAIQVFATDIDENMLARAREGLYPESILTDIAPARLRNFFQKEAGGYLVKKTVRERVLFAVHNVLKDPPFSRLDLVSCRNLMIYLTREVQEQILALFHFALRPGGYLFLGSSESADSTPKLFAALDKKHRVFRGNIVSRAIEQVPTLPLGSLVNRMVLPSYGTGNDRRHVSFGELHQRLLEQYAPPSVIITHEYDIVHLSDRAGRFLQFAGGEPSHNLLKVIHPELRLDLRTALFQALQTGKSVEARRVRLLREGRISYVNMIARPVPSSDETQNGYILVIFDEVEDTLGTEGKEERHHSEPEPLVAQLENELHRTKEQLQATIEQYETASEEMKAANEELQAINEELRSTTEELETSKEELQSINEELMTVNYELKGKVDEITNVNSDLMNLISSTEIATVFVDRQLKVKRFTPRALDIFNLISTDIGRPLLDVTYRLDYANLAADVEQVFDRLTPIEREVVAHDGRWYMARVLPYRTLDDRIDGAVLTFVDFTARKHANETVRRSEERLQRVINIETVGVVFFNNDIEITECNDAFLRMSGYTREELKAGRFSWEAFTPEEFLASSHRAIEELQATGHTTPYEKQYIRKDGSRFWALFAALRISENEIVEFVTDITEQKRAEAIVRESEEKYRHIFNSIDEGLCVVEVIFDAENHPVDYLFLEINAVFEQMTGLENVIGKTAYQLVPQLEPFWVETYGRIALTGNPERFENYSAPMNRWFDVHASRTGDETSRKIVIVFSDITERKQTDEKQHEYRKELEVAVRARTTELTASYETLLHEVSERRNAEERVKEMLRLIISAQEDERRRLSRELHDHFGQQLTALRMGIEALPGAEQSAETIEHLRQMIKRLDEEVDFLAWELRPAALDDLGLTSALATFMAEWSEQFGVPAEVHATEFESRLAPEVETNLYRIVQEALNNIAKHAQASHVAVLLERRDGNAVLIIEDNGVGFEAPASVPNPAGKGLGIVGMQERAALIGGSLEIESSPGAGTTIFVRVPEAKQSK